MAPQATSQWPLTEPLHGILSHILIVSPPPPPPWPRRLAQCYSIHFSLWPVTPPGLAPGPITQTVTTNTTHYTELHWAAVKKREFLERGGVGS